MSQTEYSGGLEAGGAPIMWVHVLNDALPHIRECVPWGSEVIEIGYGDGLLSCYHCSELEWKAIALEIDPDARAFAVKNAECFYLNGQIEFKLCMPEKTREHKRQYDTVFIKTVLYNSQTIKEYKD